MRIAVIGAGIVGVHVAVALTRRGEDVILIDRGEPGGETTAGSFAWIDASAPGIAPYLELRVLGVEAWQRQAQELGRPRWLSLPGTLTWARAGAQADTLQEHARRLEALGREPQRLSVREALRREPGLRLPPDLECVYCQDGEGWVQTGPAVAALLKQGSAAGLNVRIQTEVREPSVDSSGRVAGLVLASGERLETDMVVTCLGRFTEPLLALAGVRVPMLVAGHSQALVAGLVVKTSPVRSPIGRVILADGLLMRPADGERLLMHSDACDAELTVQRPGPGDGEKLLVMLGERLAGTEQARVHEQWVCHRAIPADLLPVVGRALDGLYVVATHSGVTLAPALAELVASELLEDSDHEELQRFRPGRYLEALETTGDR